MATQLVNSARLTTENFEQLFFEYQPRLVRFAVRRGIMVDDAEWTTTVYGDFSGTGLTPWAVGVHLAFLIGK